MKISNDFNSPTFVNKVMEKNILSFADSLDKHNMLKYNYMDCTGDCTISISEDVINIFDLMNKCKTYILKNYTLILNSNVTNTGMIKGRTIIIEEGEEIKIIEGTSEYESVFKACDWIEKNKKITN